MISSVTLGTVTLKCDNVDTPQEVVVVRDVVPGRTEEVVQQVAMKSKDVNLHGILIGTDMDTDRITLVGYKNMVVAYNDGVDSFNVLVLDAKIPTVGGRPNHYEFTIRGVKV